MSNLAATPPSIATTSLYPSVFDDEPPHAVLALIDDGHSLTPESRPVDPRAPIPEEDEETSSEAAIEPITPTETQHSQMFHTKMSGGTNGHPLGAIRAQPPLILNTAATPPPSAGSNDGTNPTPFAELQSPRTPVLKRPGVSSKDGSLKRTMSATMTALFGGRRSNSSSEKLSSTPFTQEASRTNRSDTMLGTGRLSTSRGSTANSPTFSRSNTPPSPSSPIDAERGECHYAGLEPCDDRFFNKQKNRSSTGHSFRDRFSNHKISFSTAAHQHKPDQSRHRATSVDLEQGQSNQSEAPELSRQPWGMVAETGIGLKSRRMSLNLPNDFTVEVVELYSEFGDQSKLLGRRGKNLGQGATANVRLMQRKGYAGELYAVKEFRGKSSNEDKEEYEKKIKSEYSIAKSLHHPNIVETIRLCTHKGKWNHVMEFCEQGDLFSLVNQKYLDQAGHKVDRLCLFKQLIQGLNYLHSHGIAHRDVKLENLLITKDSKLKITDFGVSEVFAGIHPGLKSAGGQCGKEMQDVRLCAPGICGSPPYIAPEVIAKKGKLHLKELYMKLTMDRRVRSPSFGCVGCCCRYALYVCWRIYVEQS